MEFDEEMVDNLAFLVVKKGKGKCDVCCYWKKREELLKFVGGRGWN